MFLVVFSAVQGEQVGVLRDTGLGSYPSSQATQPSIYPQNCHIFPGEFFQGTQWTGGYKRVRTVNPREGKGRIWEKEVDTWGFQGSPWSSGPSLHSSAGQSWLLPNTELPWAPASTPTFLFLLFSMIQDPFCSSSPIPLSAPTQVCCIGREVLIISYCLLLSCLPK